MKGNLWGGFVSIKSRYLKELLIVGLIFLTIITLVSAATWITKEQSDFDGGTYSNTEYNATGGYVQLSPENTTGNYTSKIFDANSTSSWNNISWIENIPTSFDSNLFFALHLGSEVTEVYDKDETYYLADIKDANKRFYLNFSNNLVNQTILKIYAKQSNGVTIGIYAQTDTSGSNPFGTFTVTSGTGEWYNVALNIDSPTNATWFGEGTDSGTDPKDYFDYIFAEIPVETNITFQARSDNDNSSWGPFTGPDGTSATYYTNASGEDLNVPNNRYFQYIIYFETNNTYPLLKLYNVTIDYTSDSPPNITALNYPTNNSVIDSVPIDFNFTVEDDIGFTNCTLYGNFGGSWKANEVITNIINASINNITISPAEGTYIWNVLCYDNATTPQSDWYENNYTVSINLPKGGGGGGSGGGGSGGSNDQGEDEDNDDKPTERPIINLPEQSQRGSSNLGISEFDVIESDNPTILGNLRSITGNVINIMKDLPIRINWMLLLLIATVIFLIWEYKKE